VRKKTSQMSQEADIKKLKSLNDDTGGNIKNTSSLGQHQSVNDICPEAIVTSKSKFKILFRHANNTHPAMRAMIRLAILNDLAP
jgi:hypothetical protein